MLRLLNAGSLQVFADPSHTQIDISLQKKLRFGTKHSDLSFGSSLDPSIVPGRLTMASPHSKVSHLHD